MSLGKYLLVIFIAVLCSTLLTVKIERIRAEARMKEVILGEGDSCLNTVTFVGCPCQETLSLNNGGAGGSGALMLKPKDEKRAKIRADNDLIFTPGRILRFTH